MPGDPWSVLGIARSAPIADARRAYIIRLKLLHPDRHQGSEPEILEAAEAATVELNDAWKKIQTEYTVNAKRQTSRTSRQSDLHLMYLLLDESAEMRHLSQELSAGFSLLSDALTANSDSEIQATIRIIGFSDRAREIRFSPTIHFEDRMPQLTFNDGRRFADALRLARRRVELDTSVAEEGIRIHRPLVIVLTGGEAELQDDWEPAASALAMGPNRQRPATLSFGVGGVSISTLTALSCAGSAFSSDLGVSESEATSEFFAFLANTLIEITSIERNGNQYNVSFPRCFHAVN